MSWQAVEVTPPPSANALWRYGRGRCFRSAAYVRWLEDVRWDLQLNIQDLPPGPLEITITILGGTGFRVNRDLDNVGKPTIDALRYASVLESDSVKRVQRVVLEYIERKKQKGEVAPEAVMRISVASLTCKIKTPKPTPKPTRFRSSETSGAASSLARPVQRTAPDSE